MYRKHFHHHQPHRPVLPQIDEEKETFFPYHHTPCRSKPTTKTFSKWMSLFSVVLIGLGVREIKQSKTARFITAETTEMDAPLPPIPSSPIAQHLIDTGQAIRASVHSNDPNMPMDFDLLVFPPHVDKVISREIVQHGTYEPEMSRFVHHALTTQNDSNHHPRFAVDIGANVGFHTLHMGSLGATVVAFEPAPDTGDLLQGSLELNPSMSIHLVRAAASDTAGSGQLHRHPDSPGIRAKV